MGILSSAHGGDLMIGTSTGTWIPLPKGPRGTALIMGPTRPYWAALATAGAHNLLSATHPDTTPAAPVRGDLIVGSGVSPLWTRLPKGALGTFLKMGADEPGWAVHGLTFADVGAAPLVHGHAWADVSKVGSSLSDLATRAVANLSDGSNVALLNAANIFTGGFQSISGAAGTYRLLSLETATVPRWRLGANDTAESGSNVGSDFRVVRYDDGGNYLGFPLQIVRATGAATFENTLAWGGGTAISSSTNVPRLDAANAFTNVGVNSFVGAVLSPTIYGSSAANGDLTIEGTSHATKTTSYVILQPTGGFVGIGTTGPGVTFDIVGTAQDDIQTVQRIGVLNTSAQTKFCLVRIRANAATPLVLLRSDSSGGTDPSWGFAVGTDTPALLIQSGGGITLTP